MQNGSWGGGVDNAGVVVGDEGVVEVDSVGDFGSINAKYE